MLLPIRTLLRPSALNGQQNGRLDPGILKATPGQAGGLTVELVEPAARGWRAMTAAAKKAGHILKQSGASCSYRPYAVQERIFRERYTTTNNGTPGRLWNGRYWYKKPGVAAAAVPGTSNHGWGLAVDIGEERDGDTGAESMDDATVAWLVNNAHLFGFSAELQSEPWHWRLYTGDTPTAATIAYERSLKPEVPFMALTDAEQRELLEKVRQLCPWPPEKLNAAGNPDPAGKPAARHLRWISETVQKIRKL